jgi:futalosine hydrolase
MMDGFWFDSTADSTPFVRVGMQQHLILVPTELERGRIEPVVTAAHGAPHRIELCGFGAVVAAARTASLIAEHRPQAVVLVGLAGRLSDRLRIGEAYAFEQVACHGIGAGTGAAFMPAESMGWLQWPADGPESVTRVGDVLPCTSGRVPATAQRAGLLLSACATSADDADVRSRLRLHHEAAAEDMEGFAVAAACRLAGVPLDIVRGISNTAGDRDASHWRIDAACRAAGELTAMLVRGPS